MLPAQTALAVVAPLLNLSDPMALRYYWRQWDARQLRLLLPTTVVGVALGTWALTRLSEAALVRAIAVLALVFGGLQLVLTARRRRLLGSGAHWSAGAVAGFLAGGVTTIAHSGGIIVGLYLVNVNLPPTAVLATGNALVVFSNALKLVGYWRIGILTGRIVACALLSTPLLAAGVWIGYRVQGVLPRRVFELVLATIAIVGALRLLTR